MHVGEVNDGQDGYDGQQSGRLEKATGYFLNNNQRHNGCYKNKNVKRNACSHNTACFFWVNNTVLFKTVTGMIEEWKFQTP